MKQRQRVESIPKYDCNRAQDDGNRFYSTPLGYMPSVTTVLRDDSKFADWRKYKGEKAANEIMMAASARGCWTHDASEEFLLTGKLPEFHYAYQPWFTSIKPFLDCIDLTLLTEGALWNSDQYAGATDAIGYLRDGINRGGDNTLFPDADSNEPVLIDFKTANKPIGGNKLYDYELQVSSYIKAANYIYRKEGLIIRKGIIACAVPHHNIQLFTLDRDDINQLYAHFIERLEDWHDKHTIPAQLKIKNESVNVAN